MEPIKKIALFLYLVKIKNDNVVLGIRWSHDQAMKVILYFCEKWNLSIDDFEIQEFLMPSFKTVILDELSNHGVFVDEIKIAKTTSGEIEDLLKMFLSSSVAIDPLARILAYIDEHQDPLESIDIPYKRG